MREFFARISSSLDAGVPQNPSWQASTVQAPPALEASINPLHTNRDLRQCLGGHRRSSVPCRDYDRRHQLRQARRSSENPQASWVVPSDRLIMIGYGKKRPQCTESNEACGTRTGASTSFRGNQPGTAQDLVNWPARVNDHLRTAACGTRLAVDPVVAPEPNALRTPINSRPCLASGALMWLRGCGSNISPAARPYRSFANPRSHAGTVLGNRTDDA